MIASYMQLARAWWKWRPSKVGALPAAGSTEGTRPASVQWQLAREDTFWHPARRALAPTSACGPFPVAGALQFLTVGALSHHILKKKLIVKCEKILNMIYKTYTHKVSSLSVC